MQSNIFPHSQSKRFPLIQKLPVFAQTRNQIPFCVICQKSFIYISKNFLFFHNLTGCRMTRLNRNRDSDNKCSTSGDFLLLPLGLRLETFRLLQVLLSLFVFASQVRFCGGKGKEPDRVLLVFQFPGDDESFFYPPFHHIHLAPFPRHLGSTNDPGQRIRLLIFTLENLHDLLQLIQGFVDISHHSVGLGHQSAGLCFQYRFPRRIFFHQV